jgi:hypothetical protein
MISHKKFLVVLNSLLKCFLGTSKVNRLHTIAVESFVKETEGRDQIFEQLQHGMKVSG